MTILGMKMGAVSFTQLFKSWKTYYVAALKLIAFPLIIVMSALLLKGLWSVISVEIVLGVFIAFGMPTAGLASTFSDNFDAIRGYATNAAQTAVKKTKLLASVAKANIAILAEEEIVEEVAEEVKAPTTEELLTEILAEMRKEK